MLITYTTSIRYKYNHVCFKKFNDVKSNQMNANIILIQRKKRNFVCQCSFICLWVQVRKYQGSVCTYIQYIYTIWLVDPMKLIEKRRKIWKNYTPSIYNGQKHTECYFMPSAPRTVLYQLIRMTLSTYHDFWLEMCAIW